MRRLILMSVVALCGVRVCMAGGSFIPLAIDTNTLAINVTSNALALGWEDLRFPSVIAKVGASQPPSLETFTNGIECYRYSGSQINQQYIWAQMPHSWAGTPVRMHFHVSPGQVTTTNSMVWGVEYTWAGIGTQYIDTVTLTSTSTMTAGKPYWHYMPNLRDITPPAGADSFSSMLGLRVFRDPTDPGDNCSDALYLLEFDIHYQINKPAGGPL